MKVDADRLGKLDLDADRLHEVTSQMITALASPEFVEAMRKMKATADEDRLRVAAKILTPDGLRSQGVPLPMDMRITSRYFESGKPEIEAGDSFVRFGPAFHGVRDEGGGCCCGGGASVCGGCGG